MQIKPIDNQLAIGGQITPQEVAELAAHGFRSIICNRPDDEDPGQPSFAEIVAAAAEQGVEVRHIPVTGRPAEAQAAAFAEALQEMPGPTYAYCRSGGRAGTLAVMSDR